MGNQYSTNTSTVYDPMIGNTYGRLTVLAVIRGIAPHFTAKLTCRCVCGHVTTPQAGVVKKGIVKSCGCLQRERVSQRTRTHGESHGTERTVEYTTWRNILNRCDNPKHPKYYMYGARGITVCNRWRGGNGFQNFLADMGRKPSPKHSIDRWPNKNGNYEPTNSRWATPPEQQRNMRSNRVITWRGETLCLTDWSLRLGIHKNTLDLRLRNWPLERAMTEPVHAECHNKSR